jgi:hypothetical protein
MGEVMVVKDRSINRVIDLMRKDGIDGGEGNKKDNQPGHPGLCR